MFWFLVIVGASAYSPISGKAYSPISGNTFPARAECEQFGTKWLNMGASYVHCYELHNGERAELKRDGVLGFSLRIVKVK